MIHQRRQPDPRDHRPRASVVVGLLLAGLVLHPGRIAASAPTSASAPPPVLPPPVLPPVSTSDPDSPVPPNSTPPQAAPKTDSAPEAPPGRQHLVRPGQDLESLLEQAGPGDELILWPGRYRGVSVRGIAGRRDAPIVIRGLRADDPPVIEGGAWGLRLIGVSHLRFQDIVIRKSRIDGIEIGPGEDGTRSHSIRLERIRVEDTGERPGRHGIALASVDDVMLRDVSVAGWTGSGIEIVGSRDVTVDGAHLEGRDRGELLGIRLRAGTRRTTIMNSRLVEPGLGAIALGGRSRDQEFPPDETADRDGRRWEVVAPVIEDVTILGSEIALTFLGAKQASVTHVTIVDPRRAAMRIARPRDDVAFGTMDAASISRCLIAWRTLEDPTVIEFGPGATDDGMWLEENLWWRATDPFPADTDFPGHESFPQLAGTDPVLGEDLRPRAAAAADFGARTGPAPAPTVATPVAGGDPAPATATVRVIGAPGGS
jgi:hypothetical protein